MYAGNNAKAMLVNYVIGQKNYNGISNSEIDPFSIHIFYLLLHVALRSTKSFSRLKTARPNGYGKITNKRKIHPLYSTQYVGDLVLTMGLLLIGLVL